MYVNKYMTQFNLSLTTSDLVNKKIDVLKKIVCIKKKLLARAGRSEDQTFFLWPIGLFSVDWVNLTFLSYFFLKTSFACLFSTFFSFLFFSFATLVRVIFFGVFGLEFWCVFLEYLDSR